MIIGDRIWTTVVLTGFTIVVTWTFAIPVGIYSAVRQHSIGDYVFTFIGFSGLAVPDFLLGLVLMYMAYAYFDQSVGGLFSGDYANEPWSVAKAIDMVNHLWVPAIVLGTSGTAGLIRVMRNNLLDELSKPYVVTARAKGVPPWKVILKYPVRVAANPLVSTIGYLLPSLVSGSVIVSVVLSLPTLVSTLSDSVRLSVKGKCPLCRLPCQQITALPTLRERATWVGFQRACTSSRFLCVCPVPGRSHEWTAPCGSLLHRLPSRRLKWGGLSGSRSHGLANSCGAVAVSIVAEFVHFEHCAH